MIDTSRFSFRDVQGGCIEIALKPMSRLTVPRHIHVSLQDKAGRNIFGLSEDEVKSGGRRNAAYDDTKFLSQEAEWFLGGLLVGLPDGKL